MADPQMPGDVTAVHNAIDKIRPVRPTDLDMLDPRHTVPATPLFTVVGVQHHDRLTVYCDVPVVAEWLVNQASDTPGGVTVDDTHDVPDARTGVIATIPIGMLTLRTKPRSRNKWRDVVRVS